MGIENLTAIELQQIFMPYAAKKFSELRDTKNRFVHYTSADTALKILTNREVWLRNSRIMNDFAEIHHGQNCLASTWKNHNLGDKFKSLIDSVHDGLSSEIQDSLVGLFEDRNENTFLLSVSEHGSKSLDEDKYGRLSMWRAYGGDVNVALVLNSAPFVGDSDALQAFTSPVLYANQALFDQKFFIVVENIRQSIEKLRETDRILVHRAIFVALHFAILATKHPGFSEEREWRILYSPNVWNSDVLEEADVTLAGLPQKIFKLRLKNIPEKGFLGAEVPELLDRVIIGPTQFPNAVRDVFIRRLEELNVEDARRKVVVSDIPLRR